MQALEVARLKEIAVKYNIEYEQPATPFNRNAIRTRMARVFKVPQADLFAMISDVGAHGKWFPHLRALNVVTNQQLGGVIGDNQVIVVEGLAEGAAKLGVKLFTLTPPDLIEGELMTDPFVSAKTLTAADRKQGSIVWQFKKIDEASTRMQVESDFEVRGNSQYVRGSVDHVWLDFFENFMVDLGELKDADKLCNPFPDLKR